MTDWASTTQKTPESPIPRQLRLLLKPNLHGRSMPGPNQRATHERHHDPRGEETSPEPILEHSPLRELGSTPTYDREFSHPLTSDKFGAGQRSTRVPTNKQISRPLLAMHDLASVNRTRKTASDTSIVVGSSSSRFSPYTLPSLSSRAFKLVPAWARRLNESDSTSTASVEEILEKLQAPQRRIEKARLLALRGAAAVNSLELIQEWLDANPWHEARRKVLNLLVDIAAASQELPRSLFVTGVTIESSNPTSFGGYADVFRGTLDGQTIALKRLRINDSERAREEIHRRFCKEGLIWRQLTHPNILPFLGVDKDTFGDISALGMVSPWMKRGNIMDYVRSMGYNPRLHRLRLIMEVAEGLEYLHAQGLAHGDLHGGNIFMSDDGHPCLADFGLTVISDMTISHGMTTTADAAGAARWLAPEYLIGKKTATRKTPAGDMFAFGRLCLAVCTTRRPFHDRPDISVLFLILKGEHPPRPTESECGGYPMSDDLWNTMYQCWETNPQRRPDAMSVLHSLQMINTHNPTTTLLQRPLPNSSRPAWSWLLPAPDLDVIEISDDESSIEFFDSS